VQNWIYKNDTANKNRFVLGVKGKRPLICIGINPSTATPEKLDNTLTAVSPRALDYEFDGWIMLNVYPQRATNPNNLHKRMNKMIHQQNMLEIEKIFRQYPDAHIWAAWGNLIEKRDFLKTCLKDIILLSQDHACKWISVGTISKQGHPHHPLYLKKDLVAEEFDVMGYMKGYFI